MSCVRAQHRVSVEGEGDCGVCAKADATSCRHVSVCLSNKALSALPSCSIHQTVASWRCRRHSKATLYVDQCVFACTNTKIWHFFFFKILPEVETCHKHEDARGRCSLFVHVNRQLLGCFCSFHVMNKRREEEESCVFGGESCVRQTDAGRQRWGSRHTHAH